MPYEHLEPAEAKRLLDGPDGWQYVDVRTVEEFAAGHATGAYNVPFAVRDPSGGMSPNNHFVRVMRKTFPVTARLVIGCASGVRSERACELLQSAGYTNLVNMLCGFAGARDPSGRIAAPGWQGTGLPCETSGAPERTYAALTASK